MFPENFFKEMRCLTILTITFMICTRIQFFACFDNIESDRHFKEEVRDFADYLKQKLEKQAVSNSHLDPILSAEDSVEENGADYLDDYSKDDKKQADPDFESFLEDLVHSNSNDKENLRDSERISPREKLASVAIEPNPEKSTSDVSAEQHHGVEEIVYIRRSESELNDPIPEMIEKLVNDQPAEYSTRFHRHIRDVKSPVETPAADDTSAMIRSDGVCPIKNLTSYINQTCSDGPEYEVEFHAALFENLKHQMEDMLPKTNEEESKCDFGKRLGPETGVEDRALCPFDRRISSRNPSRIPEYLYEAKCSCQVWKPGKRRQFECVEVKISIPVLWLTSCDNGKKRYKQGWEEIAVACAPVEKRTSDSLNLNSSE